MEGHVDIFENIILMVMTQTYILQCLYENIFRNGWYVYGSGYVINLFTVPKLWGI